VATASIVLGSLTERKGKGKEKEKEKERIQQYVPIISKYAFLVEKASVGKKEEEEEEEEEREREVMSSFKGSSSKDDSHTIVRGNCCL